MNRKMLDHAIVVAMCYGFSVLTGCGGGGSSQASAPPDPVTIVSHGANAVSMWSEVATNTINVAPSATGTPEERSPNTSLDLATVHVAIYDAVIAIAGTHTPYAVTPTVNPAGASMDAAASAAAYGVLKGLFPNRTSVYQGTYDSLVAAIAGGDEKDRGLALGAEVARGILNKRAADGRDTILAPYVPGTAPGNFRGTNPINRTMPYVRPFSLESASQFRAPGPPALESSAYTADFNETKAFGSANSTVRTASQTELARFAAEGPATFTPRNIRQFATASASLAENVRLMAMLTVAVADVAIACFDSKYHYEFWRPTSAITLADTDPNADTIVEAGWTPVVPTPNHPEYPAAHSCVSGAIAETLRSFYGTRQISFTYTSTVADTVPHPYTNTDDFMRDLQMARIYGGMHFRTSTVHGGELGTAVARWVAAHHFGAR